MMPSTQLTDLRCFADHKLGMEPVLHRDTGIFPWSATPSCCSHGIGLKLQAIPQYGTDLQHTVELRTHTTSYVDFAQRFLLNYARFRAKPARFLFDKTPENVHTAKLILELIPDARFVHIVRHPLYVVQSLVSRGFPLYIALSTWLVDVAAAYQLRSHPRVTHVRYEDLVADPFAYASRLAQSLGKAVAPEEIKMGYELNAYRRNNRNEIKTWKVRDYGTVADANVNSSDIAADTVLGILGNARIRAPYAELFGLPEVSSRTLCEHFGYHVDWHKLRGIPAIKALDARSLRHLLEKWRAERAVGDAKVTDLLAYIAPLG